VAGRATGVAPATASTHPRSPIRTTAPARPPTRPAWSGSAKWL
jgi:hypothetical protein